MVKRGAGDVVAEGPGKAKRPKRTAVPADAEPDGPDGGQDQQPLRCSGPRARCDVPMFTQQAAAVNEPSGAATDKQDGSREQGHAETQSDGNTASLTLARAPDIQEAAARLVQLEGIAMETALNALKETHESVMGKAGNESLLNLWLEEAQVWLACALEVQAEIEDVRTAMHESLQEHEAQKAVEDVPLVERPPDFLRERFMPDAAAGSSRAFGSLASIVIRRITAFTCYRALFAVGNHKAPLVKLAELERNCHKWYSCNKGTARYWERVADECTAVAAGVTGAGDALMLEGWISCEQGAPDCNACAAAQTRDEGGCAGPSTSSPAAASNRPRSAAGPDVGAAVLAAVGGFASRKLPDVEDGVFKMPELPGQIPEIFGVLGDPPENEAGSDSEFCEILASEEAKDRALQAVELP